MSFFYGPYNSFYNMHKHMRFDPRKVNTWCAVRDQILQKDDTVVDFFNQTVADTKIDMRIPSNMDRARLKRLSKPVATAVKARQTTRLTTTESSGHPQTALVVDDEPEVAVLDLGWVKKQLNLRSTRRQTTALSKVKPSATVPF